MTFVNLPVSDVARSRAFFTRLGFTFNESFSDDQAAALVVSEQSVVMLLAAPFFAGFVGKPVADGSTIEVAVGLSATTRAEVDELVDRALALGGTAVREAQDEGFVYGRSFYDLDGHLWELIWTDASFRN